MIRDREILGEFVDEGFHLENYDDDAALWFKDTMVATLPEALRSACQRFKDRLNGSPSIGEIRHCRNCLEWRDTYPWKGNCNKHPWKNDKYSEDASANGCEDYVDRYTKYQMASSKEV